MTSVQMSLLAPRAEPDYLDSPEALASHLRDFSWDGRATSVFSTAVADGAGAISVETFVNEFWTSRQRAAHSLHEVSYRACFKPQLPRFFIERLTRAGDAVYDPFMGRGTTLLEAALLGRVPIGCDINPLSRILVEPRLNPPDIEAVRQRLSQIDWGLAAEAPEDLLTFYHPETLREICALKGYLFERRELGSLDAVDGWIRMVALNRLTGHSAGFFSVYTLPPNQAVSLAAQRKINADRHQSPSRRSVPRLILAKSRALLADYDVQNKAVLNGVLAGSRLLTGPASSTPDIPSETIDLIVTSPPFLDVVDYAGDNWLRCWFGGVDPHEIPLTILRKIADWRAAMAQVFVELARVLKHGGYVGFEVGEVRSGRVRLEDYVLPCGIEAGLEPVLVLINSQAFTKTAACWGVDNNRKGTNTNRVVLFRKG
jgi:hypothetical protein